MATQHLYEFWGSELQFSHWYSKHFDRRHSPKMGQFSASPPPLLSVCFFLSFPLPLLLPPPLLFFPTLRQCQFWLAWNSLRRPHWPQTHRNPSASAAQMLALEGCTAFPVAKLIFEAPDTRCFTEGLVLGEPQGRACTNLTTKDQGMLCWLPLLGC